ncbi:hypothetical protein P7K49_005331 [Saguinus oedipus]|uniref:Uncharacterized protein n=1 Tax=Saguinus oedipus TaxID=9490 RepID=A0ABQ9W9Y2_SAGOE|nr:hypothetical protein P7K49_005331 [Saguinus oedipus]
MSTPTAYKSVLECNCRYEVPSSTPRSTPSTERSSKVATYLGHEFRDMDSPPLATAAGISWDPGAQRRPPPHRAPPLPSINAPSPWTRPGAGRDRSTSKDPPTNSRQLAEQRDRRPRN